MKFQLLNNEPLKFFNPSGELMGTIDISSSGDMFIRAESGSSRNITIGDQNTAADVTLGITSAPVDLKFLGGGTITANNNTLNIGAGSDVVKLNNVTFSQSMVITGSVTVTGSINAHSVVGSATSSFEFLELDYDNLPTSDPGVKGRIYRNGSNQLLISAG